MVARIPEFVIWGRITRILSRVQHGCSYDSGSTVLHRAGYHSTPDGLAKVADLFTNHLPVVSNRSIGIDSAVPLSYEAGHFK